MKIKKLLVGNPSYHEFKNELKIDELFYLIFDLPFKCNYNCLKCYRKQNVCFDDLDMDLRKQKIREAEKLGVKVICIAGEGEPLYHKEAIKELIEFINSLDLIAILYTNASLLDRETVQFLFDNNVSLMISCDSFNSETYKELTGGGGNFEQTFENIKIAKEIYKKGVQKINDSAIETRLGLITTVCNQNKNEISSMKEWCGDEVFMICNSPIKEGNAIKNWEILVGENINDIMEVSHKFTDTGYAGLSTPRKDGKCAALYNGITVDTNGNVLVCPASVNTSMGNIKNESLENIWRKAKQYVKENGSPLCIARKMDKSFFKFHDGNIVQNL